MLKKQTNKKNKLRKDLKLLKRRLCKIKGNKFQCPSFMNEEIDFQLSQGLLYFGTFFNDKLIILKKGKPMECHKNSRRWARKATKYRWYKGLALSKDGIWRVHSWILEPKGLIETTEIRILYYGIPMSLEK